MSGISLEALSLEYARDPGPKGALPRRAKKLCAPCCHLMPPHRVKYCDAVAVAGEMYCAAHLPGREAVRPSLLSRLPGLRRRLERD